MPTETPRLVTDCVVIDGENRVLLARRKNEPFAGVLGLPGGFVEAGETVEAACRRELREETNIEAGALTLVGVYSDPARDPRGHNVSIAFLTEPEQTEARAGSDAAEVLWMPVADLAATTLAFDHRQIIADALAARGAPSSTPPTTM